MIPLRDDVRSNTRPYVTWALIAACALVYMYQMFSDLADPESGHRFILTWGMIPADITHGRGLWTLLTSMFLHGGILHALGNLWYLWIFGDNVEDFFGHLPYLGIYLFCGIVGSLLHIAFVPGSPIPTIGASGAISGVMGAYMILYPKARVLTLVPIFFFIRFFYLRASILLGLWIGIQVLYGCSAAPGTSGVAYFAHIGGFAVGVLIALFFKRRRRRAAIWYDVR